MSAGIHQENQGKGSRDAWSWEPTSRKDVLCLLPQTPSQLATRMGDPGRKVLTLWDAAGVQGSVAGS